MAYYVNKTNGTSILVLDGTKDTTSTSLTLLGRLVQNYGEQSNENFVRLLENFAYTSSPAYPIVGQLWFDTNTNNIKVYDTDGAWVTVGSVIEGNVALTGNLFVGPNSFSIQDLGNVTLTNHSNNANVSFYSNVAGVNTRLLHIDGTDGLVKVNGNATANFGVTTKIYVDSEITKATSGADTNLLANIGIINANLALRVGEEDQLRANITAANVQINLRDTIVRVNSINTAIDTALQANVFILNELITARYYQTVAVDTALKANVIEINSKLSAANASIVTVNNSLNSVNLAKDVAIAANVAVKAPIDSPTLTGVPLAPTAPPGTNTLQIATTQYVMSRSAFWDGSAKFVSTANPTEADGDDGDIWFKYT